MKKYTVCCNIKQSETAFKRVVNLGKGKYASYTVNTITNDLGRSWGVTMYIYIFCFSRLLLSWFNIDQYQFQLN